MTIQFNNYMFKESNLAECVLSLDHQAFVK